MNTSPHLNKARFSFVYLIVLLLFTSTIKANTCATADTLANNGSMMQSTFSSSEQWFIFTTTKTISAIYGYWWQYEKAPKSIEVYSGQCGSLTALYAQSFDNHADTINQFKNKFLPGTYYIKLSGFTGEKIALALGIELLGDNCPSPDCNLAPNFSFEDHPVPTAPIPWGAFENWAECWDNGSSHPGATPDYAIDPDPTCTPSGNGNRCIGTNNYSVWPTGTPGQHATAHFFVNHVALPNRREYILAKQCWRHNTTGKQVILC